MLTESSYLQKAIAPTPTPILRTPGQFPLTRVRDSAAPTHLGATQ